MGYIAHAAIHSLMSTKTPWYTFAWNNWRLALVAALLIIPLSIWLLPLDVAFWVSLTAAGLVCFTLVVNARRYSGKTSSPLQEQHAERCKPVTGLNPKHLTSLRCNHI